ncbi:S1 family peptidase [Hoyosella sp. YIM 151337]|uniref:S1 family peptidase n=1 Tax=Hoyosella sp. YIM 151337 TaxID=2992742 RepID=UPI002235DC40|nr:S1 family peptidase [Hoyosella sp. YIM 151337]MCW4352567.1 S1 family peptidase [Hoyosella sp. YIM 151337]
MRSSFLRRAAIAGAAALTLLVPGAAVSLAAPQPAGSTLPAALIEALERDLGLSADEFLQQSELAQRLATFAEELRVEFPDEFGGAWLDNGTPTIGVTTDSLAERVEEAGFSVKNVARSESELHRDVLALSEWTESLAEPFRSLIQGVMVDLVRNSVVVGVADTGPGSLDGLFDLPALMREVGILFTPVNEISPDESTPLRESGSGSPHQYQAMGGDAFLAGAAGNQLRCSLGFNAEGPGASVINITAGHCNPEGPDSSNTPATFLGGPLDGKQFGTFTQTDMNGADYGVITIHEDFVDLFQTAGVRGGNDIHVTGTADPVVGMPVCKSGVTTGFTCGVITSANLRVDVGARTLDNAFTADICALQGDSGGAIISGTRAVGVSSASDVGDFASCADAERETSFFGEKPQLYATPINDILNKRPDIRIRTS